MNDQPAHQPTPTTRWESSDELVQLLDGAIARLAYTRRTFTEEEALSDVWAAGYEVTPQDDPRFQLAWDATSTTPRHWRLAEQTLANDRLLDELATSTWDGHDLDAALERLSESDQVTYVFCPIDPRLIVTEDGALDLDDREINLALDPRIKVDLDRLGVALLARWHEAGPEPWTVRQVAQTLGDLGWPDAWKREGWLFVRVWLLQWPSVTRVGSDYWLPTDSIPAGPARTRLAVLPVLSSEELPSALESAPVDMAGPAAENIVLGSERRGPPGRQRVVQRAQWTIRLRTVHINAGFVPVPAAAHAIYPPRGLHEGEHTVLRGLWFETGDKGWIWLDRAQHRLYGPALADQLGWCSTGDILHVEWDADAIIFRIDGHDDDVQHEEGRLIDIEELARLRGGLGESYRRSMQVILSEAPEGLTFAEVVAALRLRQGHAVARSTVRATLYAGGFVQRDGRWFMAPDNEAGARQLRRALVEALAADEQPELPAPMASSTERLRSTARTIHARLSAIIARLHEDV